MDTIKKLTYKGREVDSLLGIGRSTRYSWQDPKSPQYDPTWPLPIKLSARSTGYLVHEVEAWLASRPRARLTKKTEGQR
jgi:prophage regulatory protein